MDGPPRRLILMRHAKSHWGDDKLGDKGRSLNAQGRDEAPLVAGALRTRGWIPDAVVSSDADRTRQTWSRMEGAFDAPIPVWFSDRLYLAGLGALQGVAQSWDDQWRCVLALGHNPGWQSAVAVRSGVPTLMEPASAALLEGSRGGGDQSLESAWRLVDVIRPRDP